MGWGHPLYIFWVLDGNGGVGHRGQGVLVLFGVLLLVMMQLLYGLCLERLGSGEGVCVY